MCGPLEVDFTASKLEEQPAILDQEHQIRLQSGHIYLLNFEGRELNWRDQASVTPLKSVAQEHDIAEPSELPSSELPLTADGAKTWKALVLMHIKY